MAMAGPDCLQTQLRFVEKGLEPGPTCTCQSTECHDHCRCNCQHAVLFRRCLSSTFTKALTGGNHRNHRNHGTDLLGCFVRSARGVRASGELKGLLPIRSVVLDLLTYLHTVVVQSPCPQNNHKLGSFLGLLSPLSGHSYPMVQPFKGPFNDL